MEKTVALTRKEAQLIEELTATIAGINSQDKSLKETLFRGLSSYVEGIKVGLNFKQVSDATTQR